MAAGHDFTITSTTTTQTEATFAVTLLTYPDGLSNCTVEVWDSSESNLIAVSPKFFAYNNASIDTTASGLTAGTAYIGILKSDGTEYDRTTFSTQNAPDVAKVFRYWERNGQKYDFTTHVEENMTLTAVWADVYTVSFVDSFGDTVAPDQRVVGAPEFSFVLPDAPTISGYTFTGWYAPDGHKWDSSVDVVTSNMTLTAVYTST